jgi:ATP-dependent DNA helicase RecQ
VSDATNSDNELLGSLKRWRNHIVEEQNLPIYMVANAKSLSAIATGLPLTKKDLLQIPGFGVAKVDKYGDEIIEMVEDYCVRHNLHTNMDVLVRGMEKKSKK